MVKRPRRNVKIIFPSLITSFSMISGFAAILFAIDDKVWISSYLILVASVLDGLDGKVARLTNTASEFGIQYDSMSDLVAFGVAPAVIYYCHFIYHRPVDQLFILLPIMFLLCGAIRLARFNVTASIYGKAFFTGMPIPAAAVILSLWPPLERWAELHSSWAPLKSALAYENSFPISVVFVVILSLSMISTLKFDTFDQFWFKKYRNKSTRYSVFALFHALILIHFIIYMTAVSIYYMVAMYGRALVQKVSRSEQITSS
ncbi:MAG: CDP-diacylglycerol--serine O-phosphatidyltransferase [Acidobacteria bacterium]|nr:CDP-diacylglycerol--serine O-phosphatidyltransferase [Acidobacteriota bacterium]